SATTTTRPTTITARAMTIFASMTTILPLKVGASRLWSTIPARDRQGRRKRRRGRKPLANAGRNRHRGGRGATFRLGRPRGGLRHRAGRRTADGGGGRRGGPGGRRHPAAGAGQGGDCLSLRPGPARVPE